MSLIIHRDYLPGSIGRVVELHAQYYHRLAGFGLSFETKVACELSEFCARYDQKRDGLWLAQRNGVIEGSIAVDGSHVERDGAHLRWFITSDNVRGTGVGTALLASAMAFCRLQHYERAYLWTFEDLRAARHLYEKFGFRLTHQQRGAQWGAEVNEQRFELRA
jgi:GNAT superfamily N-acetyltransferase